MTPIERNNTEAKSADLIAQNIETLKQLFPEAVTEGKIDFSVMKELLGQALLPEEERDEKYGLNWFGKRKARQIALTPSTGTLRPCKEDSVDWDTTKNLMIEGDNLEVLKLLQKSYAGQVKLIYIDPPYNTGKDFVYPDNFQDNIKNYLELTGQIEGGAKMEANTESSGRFHSDWLNMMYPRLKLAKNLLRNDGLIFISIDDSELAGLNQIMCDIFGEENFVACFIWKSRQNKDNRSTNGASIDHEYLLCFGSRIRGDQRDITQYSNPDNDPRGDWASANMVGIATKDRRPNLHYDLIDPATRVNYGCPDMGWRYEPATMTKLITENRVLWPASPDGRPRRKAFLTELDSEYTGFSTIIGENIFTRDGTADILELFGTRVFDFPKPVALIETIIEQSTSENDIILDFFAGSGTTGHAVFRSNLRRKSHNRFIMVQLPQKLSVTVSEQKTAADYCLENELVANIASLTIERLRLAIEQLNTDEQSRSFDLGFRVFKLDTSNILPWEPDWDKLDEILKQSTDHVKEGRSESDILYELLLKLGLDLAVPIEEKDIAGKKVYSIGAGALIACLANNKSISRADADPLALGIVQWHKELAPVGETTCVFLDSGFIDDVTKTNLSAILSQHGLGNVRSL